MLNKVTGYGGVKSSGSVKGRGSVSATSAFADLLSASSADEAPPVSSLSNIGATAAVGSMLSLQEITEEEVRRRKLAQQGGNMLAALEELRRRLLEGRLPAETLLEMTRQLNVQKQQVMDPRLNEIIADIELRLAVELAKIETALGTNIS